MLIHHLKQEAPTRSALRCGGRVPGGLLTRQARPAFDADEAFQAPRVRRLGEAAGGDPVVAEGLGLLCDSGRREFQKLPTASTFALNERAIFYNPYLKRWWPIWKPRLLVPTNGARCVFS